jgi:23S rRNA (adenine2030-N6)-methyltransferase
VNYRHAFHAGNFADCFKHALLLWLLSALMRKPSPLFVLDTHAGAGVYNLGAGPAERTGEWRGGIGRLLDDTPEVLADYVGLVRELELLWADRSATPPPLAGGGRGAGYAAGLYPGSPALIRARLRPGDRLACCELHPEEYAALRRRFARDGQVGVHHRDGWEALGALLPPAERRGLVLIDPPYEAADEFDRLLRGLRTGHARFATSVFAAWYPIKHRAPSRRFLTAVAESRLRDAVAAELWLRAPLDPARLNGCGMLIVNPPFRFGEEARAILAALLDRLGTRETGEGTALTRLTDE